MPASNVDIITSALHNAIGKTKWKQRNDKLLDDHLNASSKQIFLQEVEFEKSHVHQSFVISNLKSKYVTIIGKKRNKFSSLPLNKPNDQMPPNQGEDGLEAPRVTLWPADKVTLGWRKSFPPGAGLVNLGNTCYINSSLQALFHIPSLVNWLLEEINTHIPNCESSSQNASFCSICCMMKTLRSALDRCNTLMKPSLIHNKLKCIGKTLVHGRQEDAHEFIKMLIDHMEKSFLHYKRAFKLDHRSKETTPLNQIFGGYLRQQVICPLCCYVSTTFSHFQDLVLDIKSVGSVDEALALYFRKEKLDKDNAYKCEKCHKRVPATKRYLVERAPHVLLLQLKRFTIGGGKITKHINIQKTVDLSRFVTGAKGGGEAGGYSYRLVSMVIHLGGSQHGGHYTAVAEASNRTMYEFDDSSVRQISMQSALLRNPYILFYEMMRKPDDPSWSKHSLSRAPDVTAARGEAPPRLSATPNGVIARNQAPPKFSTTSNGFVTRDVAPHKVSSPLPFSISQSNKLALPNHKDRKRISFELKPTVASGNGDSVGRCGGLKARVGHGTPAPTAPPKTSSSSLVPYNGNSSDDSADDAPRGADAKKSRASRDNEPSLPAAPTDGGSACLPHGARDSVDCPDNGASSQLPRKPALLPKSPPPSVVGTVAVSGDSAAESDSHRTSDSSTNTHSGVFSSNGVSTDQLHSSSANNFWGSDRYPCPTNQPSASTPHQSPPGSYNAPTGGRFPDAASNPVDSAGQPFRVVEWNRDFDDVSTPARRRFPDKEFSDGPVGGGVTDHRLLDSVDSVHKWRFGSKTSTWHQGPSLLDAEHIKAVNEATKRTSDDLYNESLDAGRVRKKSKPQFQDLGPPNRNAFQWFQEKHFNGASPFSGPGHERASNGKFHNRRDKKWWPPRPEFGNRPGGHRGNFFDSHKNRDRRWYSNQNSRKHGRDLYHWKRNNRFLNKT